MCLAMRSSRKPNATHTLKNVYPFFFAYVDTFIIILQILLQLQETIGKDCKITEPYYNITFDLSSLRKEDGYKLAGYENDQLDFNVCGKLKSPCGDAKDVAACLVKNEKHLKFGKYQTDGYFLFLSRLRCIASLKLKFLIS